MIENTPDLEEYFTSDYTNDIAPSAGYKELKNTDVKVVYCKDLLNSGNVSKIMVIANKLIASSANYSSSIAGGYMYDFVSNDKNLNSHGFIINPHGVYKIEDHVIHLRGSYIYCIENKKHKNLIAFGVGYSRNYNLFDIAIIQPKFKLSYKAWHRSDTDFCHKISVDFSSAGSKEFAYAGYIATVQLTPSVKYDLYRSDDYAKLHTDFAVSTLITKHGLPIDLYFDVKLGASWKDRKIDNSKYALSIGVNLSKL